MGKLNGWEEFSIHCILITSENILVIFTIINIFHLFEMAYLTEESSANPEIKHVFFQEYYGKQIVQKHRKQLTNIQELGPQNTKVKLTAGVYPSF